MNANELRYKNYIQLHDKAWQVNDVFGASGLVSCLPNENGEWVSRRSIHDYDPIPLTEEWLLKFGFENFLGGYSIDGFRYWPSDKEFTIYEDEWMNAPDSCRVHVEFVHQLQNIYFALTGEELTYKA